MNPVTPALSLIGLLLVGSPVSVSAEPPVAISTFFTNSERDKALRGEIITYASLEGDDAISTEADKRPVMTLPDTPYTLDGDYQTYEMLTIEKAFIPHGRLDSDDYHRLSRPEALVGMPYYSRTDGSILPLILAAARIEPLQFPVQEEAQLEKGIAIPGTEWLSMTDNRFGELRYKREIFHSDDSLITLHTSITPMKRLFSTINGPGENRLGYFLLYDQLAGGYFYFAFHAMRIRSSLLLNLGLLSAESFANRVRAGTVNIARQMGHDWRKRLAAFK